jgi:ABC-type protease/lipase transport system fused ATPase/permease subunit
MTGVPDPDVAGRRQRVVTLRASGLSYAAIAREVGLPSAAHAATDAARYLESERMAAEETAPWDAGLALERLNRWQRACEYVLTTAQREGDRTAILGATDRLLRIAGQRAALSQGEPLTPAERRARRLGRAALLECRHDY